MTFAPPQASGEWLAAIDTASEYDNLAWSLGPILQALQGSSKRRLQLLQERLAQTGLVEASGPQGSHPVIARLGATLSVWRVSTPDTSDFLLGRDADGHSIVLRVVNRQFTEADESTTSVFHAFRTCTYLGHSSGGICEMSVKFSMEATLGIAKGSDCELVVLESLVQPSGKLHQVPLGTTHLCCSDGHGGNAHLDGYLVLRIVPTVRSHIPECMRHPHVLIPVSFASQAADAIFEEFPYHIRKGGKDFRQVPFADYDKKLLIAIMPTFRMDLEGQKVPFSATWYRGLALSEINMDATRVALLAKDENAEISSEAELRDAVQRFLAPLMRVDPSDPKSKPVPTSLYLGSHGSDGKVHYSTGGPGVAVADLVAKIIGWLPRDLQGYVCHVHFDACESMSGVSPLDGITLSGYTAEVDTSTSTFFFSYMAAAAERAIASSEGVHAAAIAAELVSPRTTDMGEALLASEVSMADLVADFIVLPPQSDAKVHGATNEWYCDGCSRKKLSSERYTLRGGKNGDTYDLCSVCYDSASDVELYECVRPVRSATAAASASAPADSGKGSASIHATLEDSVVKPLREGLASSAFSEGQGCALARGSCFDFIKLLPDDCIDLICVDPPYGDNYGRTGGDSYKDVIFEADEWATLIKEGWRVLTSGGRQLIFCSLGLFKQLLPILQADPAISYKWHSWQRSINSRGASDRCHTYVSESNEYILIVWIREGVWKNKWYVRLVSAPFQARRA